MHKLKSNMLFVIFIFLNQLNSAQNSKIDSLLKVSKESVHDTALAKAFLHIGEIYRNTDLDSSMNYYVKALAIAEKALTKTTKADSEESKKFKSLQSTSLRCIGIIHYIKGEYEIAIDYYNKSYKLCKAIEDKKGMSACTNNIALIMSNQGDYAEALKYYTRALEIDKQQGDKKGMSDRYNNISIAYYYQAQYDKAIENYLLSLSIREELNDYKGMVECLGNIGIVYKDLNDFEKAKEYIFNSISISEKYNFPQLSSANYNTLGVIYYAQDKFDDALKYYNKSLAIDEKFNDKRGIAQAYNNIAEVYVKQNKYQMAIDLQEKIIIHLEELNDVNGIANLYNNIANLYVVILDSTQINGSSKVEKLDSAIKYSNKAMTLAREINAIPLINNAAKLMMNIYAKNGNYEKAYEYSIIYTTTRDSIFNDEKTKALTEAEAKFKTEKKQKEIELLKKNEIIAKEKAKNQIITIISISIIALLLVFIITYIYRRLRITRRQKTIIEKQNGLLLEKNEEIIAQSDEISAQRDNLQELNESLSLLNKETTEQNKIISKQNFDIRSSITYASIIQKALIPPITDWVSFVPDNFVLWKPRDIVSGDFYWIKKSKNLLYITAADCTGHGVPGAFMSMLGVSQLNEIVALNDSIAADELLNQLRTRIKNTLHQGIQNAQTQDGMDIAVCMIDTETNVLQFSGAYNPLYLIRNNELIEYKANRMPIGVHPKDFNLFTKTEIQLQANDALYIFSDGYTSQFGGEKIETFKSKRFKEKLLEIQNQPMSSQMNCLDETIVRWQGNHQQTDDMLVIGLKIN